jgi:serine/threonine protein kinase
MNRARTGELVAGRYRLVRRLGHGGMGTVDLAHDERLDRPVALKRMHAGAPEEIARRFEREARLGAALDHPNLVQVYDVERADGAVAIAMEYVDGESVADIMTRRTFSPREAAAIVRGVAAALDHAHARGVVHRDVKPGNVLLGPHGVKLADLGISTAADATRITMAGSVLGTAAYMAPEQLAGGEVGPAADVHALALVAYELLAGVPARAGATPVELAHRIATDPPPDLRAVRPDLPVAASMALQRALAVDPRDRPATAGELATELERALAPPPDPASPLDPVAPPTPPVVAPPASVDVPERPTGNRRVLIPLALLGLLGAAVAAALLVPSNDDGGGSTGASQRRAASAADGASAGSQRSSPAASSDQRAGSTTAAAAASTGGAALDPAETVQSFYERGAAGDYDGAWALLDASGQSQFGSESNLATTLKTLESATFSRLDPSITGDSATVAFEDMAKHVAMGKDPAYTDNCRGTVTLRRASGTWRISKLAVQCNRSP